VSQGNATAGEPRVDLRSCRRLPSAPGRGHQAQIFAENPSTPGKAIGRVALVESTLERGKGIAQAARAHQRVGQQAMPGQMVRSLLDGAAERIEGEAMGGRDAQPLETRTGEAKAQNAAPSMAPGRSIGAIMIVTRSPRGAQPSALVSARFTPVSSTKTSRSLGQRRRRR
jgi:hypothetical protein